MRKETISYALVHALDVFEDFNDGFVFGIYWLDKNGNVIEAEWFKTQKERNKSIGKRGQYVEA